MTNNHVWPVTDKSSVSCWEEGAGQLVVFTCTLSFTGRDAHLMTGESAWIPVFLKRFRVSETHLRDVNRWFTDSQMCHRMCSPRWSYGWFSWFKEKTRWEWVGVFLWPQRLINNLLCTPPGSLAEADDSQVRRMQLAWMEEAFSAVGVHAARALLYFSIHNFYREKTLDVDHSQLHHPTPLKIRVPLGFFLKGWGFTPNHLLLKNTFLKKGFIKSSL